MPELEVEKHFKKLPDAKKLLEELGHKINDGDCSRMSEQDFSAHTTCRRCNLWISVSNKITGEELNYHYYIGNGEIRPVKPEDIYNCDTVKGCLDVMSECSEGSEKGYEPTIMLKEKYTIWAWVAITGETSEEKHVLSSNDSPQLFKTEECALSFSPEITGAFPLYITE